MLPTWLPAYSKRHKIDAESQRRILSVSPATLDRVLRDCKVDDIHKARKQTISALKQSIPIVDPTRKIDVAGHLYADTVAHCGDSTRGNFVWTLTVTDDLTLWILNRAIWNKGQDATCTAFLYLLREMPSWFVASTRTMGKSHGTNERRGKEKKTYSPEGISRPHRIAGKYPEIPQKAHQSHETREHFMNHSHPIRRIFLPQNADSLRSLSFWGRKMVDLPCFLVNYPLKFR